MGFIYVITTHKYFMFILLLFQIYLSLQSKLNQILLYDNINNGEREPPDDIFKRYEELMKSTKALEEKIDNLKTKNYEYNLEIEKIKVYTIILYVILSLIILIGIILIIIKFYFRCQRKSIPISMIDLKEKLEAGKDK